jgi:hypothetical protein
MKDLHARCISSRHGTTAAMPLNLTVLLERLVLRPGRSITWAGRRGGQCQFAAKF